MGSSDEVRRLLDERGIEWGSKTDCDTYWYGQDRTFYKFTEYRDGTMSFTTCQWNLTPKQVLTTPIAATVGNRTDLSKRLREVNGLHEFAELFGFSWADESDWTWHDVACAMADAVDAAMVGAGTCVDEDSDPNDFKCSVCGARSYIQANDTYTTVLDDHVTILKKFNYCPNCGRKVKEGAE